MATANVTNLLLTAREVRAALLQLDGFVVSQRTFGNWYADGTGIIAPAKWGERRRAVLFSVAAVYRTRLVVRLRQHGFSMKRIRAILQQIDAQKLDSALRPDTHAGLVIHGTRGVVVERAGRAPEGDLETGQLFLPLAPVVARVDVALDQLLSRRKSVA